MIIEQALFYHYKGFGMKIKSEIPLPELSGNAVSGDEDVFISIKDLNHIWEVAEANLNQFNILNQQVLFQVPDTAIFCIQEGKKILVSPMKDSNPDKMRLFILGSCMGALLLQRSILPLHGSAIAINGKAFAIVGESGAGKSTLAAAFISKGYSLLTDDIIPVNFSDKGAPEIAPTFPRQKLWQESLEQLRKPPILYQPLYGRETKFSVPVGESYVSQSLELGGIIELMPPSDRLTIKPIDRMTKLQTVFQHTFRSILISRLNLLEWHFKTAVCLAEQSYIYKISRPKTGFSADEMAELILETIRQEENNHE